MEAKVKLGLVKPICYKMLQVKQISNETKFCVLEVKHLCLQFKQDGEDKSVFLLGILKVIDSMHSF